MATTLRRSTWTTRHLNNCLPAATARITWTKRHLNDCLPAATARLTAAPPRHRRTAIALLALLWTAGWGIGTVAAVYVLTGHTDTVTGRTTTHTVLAILDVVAMLILAGVVAVLCGQLTENRALRTLTAVAFGVALAGPLVNLLWPAFNSAWVTPLAIVAGAYWFIRWADPHHCNPLNPPATRAAWTCTLVVAAASYLAMQVPHVILDPLLARHHLQPAFDWSQHPHLASYSALTAGLAEEPALTAAAVTLARRAGWCWPATLATALTLRIVFHLYYGWWTLPIALWAVLALGLWLLTRNLWGPILAHAASNTYATYNANGGHLPLDQATYITSAIIVCLYAIHTIQRRF